MNFLIYEHEKTLAGDVELRILKNVDEVYSPVNVTVLEKTGTNFSLICELASTERDMYDDKLSWGKDDSSFRYSSTST